MKILITNDDSISSPVLVPLARWAKKLGEVVVIAPKYEQSGKSHGINIITASEMKKFDFVDGIEAYAVDSTPADCVRYALIGLGLKFDLVISGVNKGFNLGKDINYSGTAGAVFESAAEGINSIALSTSKESFDDTVANLDKIYSFITDNKLFDLCRLYNVNVPVNTNGEIKITRQGGPFYRDKYIDQGNNMYLPVGEPVYNLTNDLSIDIDAVMNGYISISPLTVDRTDLSAFNRLSKQFS